MISYKQFRTAQARAAKMLKLVQIALTPDERSNIEVADFGLGELEQVKRYGRWLHEAGKTFGKVALTLDCLATPGYLLLLMLAAYAVWTAIRERSSLDGPEKQMAGLTALLQRAVGPAALEFWLEYYFAFVGASAVGCATSTNINCSWLF